MRRRLTITIVVALAVALVAVVAVVGLRWWQDRDRTELERATAYAPADAERLSWTDWAAVRSALGAHLDASSSGSELQSFLDDGFDRDLTSTSALVQSAKVLQARFGFSPATAEWELFSQSEQGAVVIVRMPDDADLGAVGDDLAHGGFTRPATGETDGEVWLGGDALLPTIGADLTPELQYVALDAAEHLVLTSDNEAYLEEVVGSLGDSALPDGVQDAVAASGEPLTASIYDGPYTCSALAMSHADRSDEQEAEHLITQAGEVNPIDGFAMSVQPGGHVRVAMAFESDDQARTNADSRAALASGPAPGQGGDFADRFSVASATADGNVVTLDLRPTQGSYVLSDLSTGPVLFATC
ncbi:hypothetical protein [Nocardioides sp. HB32]